jgi:hypothetical protein
MAWRVTAISRMCGQALDVPRPPKRGLMSLTGRRIGASSSSSGCRLGDSMWTIRSVVTHGQRGVCVFTIQTRCIEATAPLGR